MANTIGRSHPLSARCRDGGRSAIPARAEHVRGALREPVRGERADAKLACPVWLPAARAIDLELDGNLPADARIDVSQSLLGAASVLNADLRSGLAAGEALDIATRVETSTAVRPVGTGASRRPRPRTHGEECGPCGR